MITGSALFPNLRQRVSQHARSLHSIKLKWLLFLSI